jgi:mannose-6-phosphate isomerase-like protein (cupin superfamily)
MTYAAPAITNAVVLALSLAAYAQSVSGSSEQLLVVPPGAGPKAGSAGEWKIIAEQSGGRLAIMEINHKATMDFRPPHVHTREEEGWYVIEGELAFEVGERTVTAGPGTFVWAPRNVPHRYRVSKAPARYLLFFSPAGMEGLFKEVDEIRTLGVGTPEYEKELQRRQAKYGVRPGKLPKGEKP